VERLLDHALRVKIALPDVPLESFLRGFGDPHGGSGSGGFLIVIDTGRVRISATSVAKFHPPAECNNFVLYRGDPPPYMRHPLPQGDFQ
jgi:hypothetical protein